MSLAAMPPDGCFGVLAEYEDPDDLLAAVKRGRAAGYTKMEAYTPLPIHEICEALGHRNQMPLIVLIGGILGALTGFGLQYWASVVDYPLNVGGRPDNSWPAFIIVTFEMTILFAAVSAVLGMLALNGLPRPHHPVFNVPEFELASRNRFFLLILHYDPVFDRRAARDLLAETAARSISEVPA